MVTEKIRAAFRTDASHAIGTGHAMRCLTLASALREQGVDVLFVCRLHEGHLCALIEERGFEVHRLLPPREGWAPSEGQLDHAVWLGADWWDDAEETLSTLGGFRPDWLIIDHYGLDARWESRLRSLASRIIAIDDLADRPHDCDVLIDQNLVADQDERYGGKLPERSTLLLGPAYALLQPDYARLRSRAVPREGPVRRLLVSFGGVDRDGLTLGTVNALMSIGQPELQADIVLSAVSSDFSVVQRRIAGCRGLRLHDRLPSLAPLMLAADLAVGAGGATSWERLCLGLPALIITLADNQRPIAEELSQRGLVRWLGHANAAGEGAIRDALEEVITEGLEPAWSRRCLGIVDGRGIERVCAELVGSEK